MQSLKELIQKESKKITLLIIFFLMIIVTFFNCITAKKEANYTAQTTFYHIEQILNENQKDLNKQKKEYRQTCIDNAQAVAYSLQENPDALYNIDELKKIAQYVEVDEIHIFNKQGVIISGTHPEYYGYSFDSGKQLSFFKPLLSNQNLQLTQKIMENTASHIKMQYSALWSENKEFIVQVGMNHENASKATKKNQLSYLFKLFRVNNEAQYYAINSKNHKIVGTTHHHIGDIASSIGLKDTQIKEVKNGFFTEIDGQLSYCVSKKIKNNYIYCIIPVRVLFKEVPKNCLEMIVCLIIISILFRLLIIKYIRVYVIDSINQINHQLSKISKGQLDEEVSINNSLEFQKLSHYINEMKQSLLVKLIDRFNKIMFVPDPEKGLAVNIIADSTGFKNKEIIEKMWDIKTMIDAKAREVEAISRTSLRGVIDWIDEAYVTGELVESAITTIIGKLMLKDEFISSGDKNYLLNECDNELVTYALESVISDLEDIEITEADFA